jgi:Rrf2 family protein
VSHVTTKTGSSMRLTRAADYAVRALIHLAGMPPGQRSTLPELARKAEASGSFLSKVLQDLCRAGFVESRRGRSGGFSILPSGRAATIASVIAAMDGPIRLNICLLAGNTCDQKRECPAHSVWMRAQETLLRVLGMRTMEELARHDTHPPAPLVQLDTLIDRGKRPESKPQVIK